MENQSTNTEGQFAAGASGISAPVPAMNQELIDEVRPTRETLRLKYIGEIEARSWKTSGLKISHKLLRRKWSEVSHSIRAFLCQSPQLAAEDCVADRAADELRDNSRMLEAAIGDTGELIKTVQHLPAVETRENEVIPRTYAAVAAYLRATEWEFQESTFVAFVSGIQAIHPLRLREVWALKPLMQLVLLEKIGGATRRLSDRGQSLRDAGKSPFQVSTFLEGLRALDDVPWREICEQIGVVDHILREDPCGAYPRMDSESRDLYLQVIHQLGRFSETEEPEIASRAIALARSAREEWYSDPRARDRRSHVGFYLIDEGRALLQGQINYRPPSSERFREALLAWPEIYYFLGIELLTFAIIAFLLVGARAPVSLIAGLFLLCLPATEAAWGAMNQLIAFILPPRILPKLDFSEGIPLDCAAIAVVPTLLLNEAYVRRMVRELEIRYLANRDANLCFALLTDSPDSQHPSDQSDELVSLCSDLMEGLNRKYAGEGGSPFFLFHRYRTFNSSEGSWMGWERKRGKLLDLNDLLRGERDSFPVKVGNLSALHKIRYVITVDSDTQLPRDVARRLVGTIAHPLNRAVIDPRTNTVVEGYGMLQPRVGISVQSASRSLLANLYSGQTGFDLYTRATSDVYQDLFGEGNFAGKGIYEVDVFRQVLGQRFPCNAILSHDLIEGAYTRAGLASDIEVIDDYPTHFGAYSRRKHRWARGDWQIMLWLLPRVSDALGKKVPNPLSLLSRWKILDNLRRSLVEIATFVLLLAGWLSLPGSPRRWTLVVLVLLLIPAYLRLSLAFLKVRPGQNLKWKLKEIGEAFLSEQINVFFTLAFLSHQTLVMLDAILRTIVRVTITRKKLLEWETAAEAEVETRKTPVDVYLGWTPWLSLMIAAALGIFHRVALPDAAPLLVLWAYAGPLARWLNRPLSSGKTKITRTEEEFLRSACLRTWRYFRQSAKNAPHELVPDNIQESPPRVAHRISPTNLGLQLNAELAAYELGYLTLPEFVLEVGKILETAQGLRRFRGHFLNWYDTQTLEPLEPWFVSTVDSGNLACSLWTLKQGCLKMMQAPLLRDANWQGLSDHLNLLEELACSAALGSSVGRSLRKINAQFELLRKHGSACVRMLPGLEQDLHQIANSLADKSEPVAELRWWAFETLHRTKAIREMIEQLAPWLLPQDQSLGNRISGSAAREPSELTLQSLWAASADINVKLGEFLENPEVDPVLRLLAKTLDERLMGCVLEADRLAKELARLAEEADRLVQEMDFGFLYNRSRKLLSVGYDVKLQRLHTSCYDLLASEARSAVFAAIAKGDISHDSWFHLGRAQVLSEGEGVLASWGGTMFEYLMPTLWFRHHPRTILSESARLAVRCQREWVRQSAIPWGVSEAAYSLQDSAGHYQYRAFGIPVLALRPTPHEDVVVAPYASFLALAVDPPQAVQNLQHMKEMNWLGELGFYEAADFAPLRVGSEDEYRLVRCWMAHHQGMSLLAACNLLTDGAMQTLFHSEPAICATELLLHEKSPLATKPIRRVTPQHPAGRIQANKSGAKAPRPRANALSSPYVSNVQSPDVDQRLPEKQGLDHATSLPSLGSEVAKSTSAAKGANSVDRTCA